MTTDNPAETPAPATEGGPVETVRKVYAKDLREKDRVHTVFRVTQKNKVTARSGKVFLALTLGDKSGELDARIFDKVDTFEPLFAPGDHVLVQGHVINFHGKLQVVVESLERLDPGPLDLTEFEPPPAPPAAEAAPAQDTAAQDKPQEKAQDKAPQAQDKPQEATSQRPAREERPGRDEGAGARAVGQIREIITERVNDPHVKQLLLAFLDDPQIAAGLPHAPAAKGIHHAYRGGLAEHLLSVIRLTLRVADHYPMADRDLLLAGALLHDVMKVAEISPEKGFEYTDEGKLVGHLVMTAQKIREKTLAIPGFPPLLEQHLTHLVLAHHGRLEHGSPRLPMTIEAYIVHALDSLDSRIASWLEAMARDPNEKWTETLKLYDRQLWKGPVPTARGKSPVEGGHRRKSREERKKAKAQQTGTPQAGAPGAEAPAERRPRPSKEGRPPREDRPPREPRPPREERPPRPPRDPSTLPQELTFKPFSALTSLTSPAAPATKPEGEGSSES
jgi:3'-5' exoribonuclease